MNITDFIADIGDEFEHSIVDEKDFLERGIISTGSLSLDVSLGTGGIPRGMFTEISGPESSGKTTVALQITKSAIDQGLRVLYIDVERALDYKYIRRIVGEFDESMLTILSPETAEDGFNIIEKALQSGLFGLIIFDSLGGASLQKEIDDDLLDANVALLPRLLTKWLRRNSFKVRVNNVAVVFINQVRDKIGTYMGGYETPGGHALKHFCALRIRLFAGGKIKEKDNIVGVLAKFTVAKNKLAPPYRSGEFPIIFGDGVDFIRDVVEFAKRLGHVRMAGAYYKFEGETLGQGLLKTKESLESKPKTLDKLINLCYNVAEIEEKPEEKDKKDE